MDLKLVIILFYIVLTYVTVVSCETQSKTTATCGSPGIPGIPGVPGSPGGVGSPGFPGTVGVKGEPGVSGNPGVNGFPGKVGAKGEPGAKGETGSVGDVGMPGNAGRQGVPGVRGPAGVKGEPGEGSKSNWKQCVWKREDGKDTGLIQECNFKKEYESTSLHVLYEGNLRSYGNGVCNRWYFTFGGTKCTKPATIEGIVFDGARNNPHHHRHIEGYCNHLPKGQVRVGFWIGKCEGFSSAGDGHTGWKSVSRIVIEEISPTQN